MGAAGGAAGGGAQHLSADAAAGPQHRRATRPYPESVTARVRRGGHGAPASTSSGSSTRSTTSTRCARPSTPSAKPVRRSPKSRCPTPATCPIPAETLYTLDYYLQAGRADRRRRVRTCWPSRTWPACCGRPRRRRWSSALRSRFDLPVHVHTHDTPGGQLATYTAAWQAGRQRGRRGGGAAGGHHQPARAVLDRRRGRAHRLRHRAVAARRCAIWSRTGRRCERCTRRSSPGCPPRPGGCTPTRSPAVSCPTCASRPSRWGSATGSRTIEDAYAGADRVLGRLVKVTPSSKVVGDLALALVGAGRHGRRIRRRPGTVRHPRLGDRVPARRTRRPARRLAGTAAHQGAGRTRAGQARPRSSAAEDEAAARRAGRRRARRTLNRLLFPGPTKEFEAHREVYGDTSRLSRQPVLLRPAPRRRAPHPDRPGRRTHHRARGHLRARRARHAHRDVHHQRPAAAGGGARRAASPTTCPPPRRPTGPTPTTSPRRSPASSPSASPTGDAVEAGQTIATIEAMKMEAAITAPKAGTVDRVAVVGHRAGRGWRPAGGDRFGGRERSDRGSPDPDRRRPVRRAPNRGAAGPIRTRHPADHRPGPGVAVQRAGRAARLRRASRCSTCTRARARLGWRRCRGVPRRRCSSSPTGARPPSSPTTSRALGRDGRGGAARHRGRRCSPAAPTGPSTWCSPIRRTRCRRPTSRRCSRRWPSTGWVAAGAVAVVERAGVGARR